MDEYSKKMILWQYLPKLPLWRKDYQEVASVSESDTESLVVDKSQEPAAVWNKNLFVLTVFNVLLCLTTLFAVFISVSSRTASHERNATLKNTAFFCKPLKLNFHLESCKK